MREGRDTERQRRSRARRYEREDAREYRRRPDRRSDGQRRRRDGGSKNLPLVLSGIIIAAIAIVILANSLFKETGGSSKKADIAEQLGISSENGVALILDGEVTDEPVLVQDDRPFISIAEANSIYGNFYYDSEEGHLLVTGASNTVEGASGTDFITEGDEVYISLDFLQRFAPIYYELYSDPSRLELMTKAEQVTETSVKENAKMRVSADKKAAVLLELDKKDAVYVLDENEDWAQIRYQGVTGYVQIKALSDKREETTTPLEGGAEADASYTKNLRDHKIVLGFHNLAVKDANSYLDEAAKNVKGMNVIAPTWFSLSGTGGDLYDLGSTEYVEKAHGMGYEVWGVVDNFNQETDTNAVLSHTSTRQVLEQNIINAALTYGMEGINIDFEQLPGETGDDFSQFLRELSIYTRANGLVLSIDNYVPQDYTDFYRRDIQGRVADYVIIMGYDEHTSASEEAGSVASLSFVTQGIEDTLKEVPAEQVINAIPFYTRKWAEEGGTLSCESLGMREAQAFISDNGAKTTWDADACQNYASFEKNGVNYSIWLEDAESISSKLAVMAAHDLAGVGCWKLTQETPDIWDTIATYYPSGS
ncbi:MAG: glycosyl hydrolase family 18 [Lachnospiraceae bacterium]|nr:glycosyl hydrolase family 18 [Lachnospiraceae bacterium]